MATLLQTLLVKTLPRDTDPILRSYIETILPALEQEFSLASALGGSEEAHYQLLCKIGEQQQYARQKAYDWSQNPDQSLMVHVLNALLTCWNLIPYLSKDLCLSDIEKRLLCLGMTLHDHDKHCRSQGKKPPHASEVPAILEVCQDLGEKLDFDLFWSDWRNYLLDIAFLAQNTQFKHGTNLIPANWTPHGKFQTDTRRLTLPLRHLVGFGDIAVHLKDSGDIDTKSGGDRLREHLYFLKIKKRLVFHRLRDSLGIMTNVIHNATIEYAKKVEWQPILFFAQGVVYLAPENSETPERLKLHEYLWQQVSGFLGSKMLGGDIGFKRDGKGLKVAPQTLELFSAAELIHQLPDVIATRVNNHINPATRKRLEKLSLTEAEKELLEKGADIRADRIAEFIFLIQKEFFGNSIEYINWILDKLEIQDKITPEQTQLQSGGVNYGWYHAAAYYITNHDTLKLEEVTERLAEWAEDLAVWADENNLLPEHHCPIREIFYNYLTQYLEVKGWDSEKPSFEIEFAAYTVAKTKAAKQPICSLSSGEFASEDQMDSVVLFKPQQYSNKNALGGRQIKRGISKIWALEMLLRQAIWSVPAGKLEEQHPVFLYIFPAYLYSPQVAAAIGILINNIKQINFWDVRNKWLQTGMNSSALQSVDWLLEEPELGRFYGHKYNSENLPFMGIAYTITRGRTLVEAWIQPAFIALTLSISLGVKVVVTSSSVPLYNSDSDFRESVILDGIAGFWNLLGLSTSLRIQDFQGTIQRLLTAYSLHLDTRGIPSRDEKWRDLTKTVREINTDVLNIFSLAYEGMRRHKKEIPTPEEVQRYWKYAQIWVGFNVNQYTPYTFDNQRGQYTMEWMTKLVQQYRIFYRPKLSESSHTILLPISKTLEVILTVPQEIVNSDESLILQCAGQLKDALDRQEVYKRPCIMDKSIDYPIREAKELEAIHTFVNTCVTEMFHRVYKRDRALLQENRNRIKSGVEFAYRWLALQENTSKSVQSGVKS